MHRYQPAQRINAFLNLDTCKPGGQATARWTVDPARA
jgi:hypothetical protein